MHVGALGKPLASVDLAVNIYRRPSLRLWLAAWGPVCRSPDAGFCVGQFYTRSEKVGNDRLDETGRERLTDSHRSLPMARRSR
ncbi:protein of unknown function [Methylocaldum szegediense]|uniref:Uncharacterized protein n=1 Tax=Methylocaldum szegediense TaxID=73780 RepID=A0ABN8X154_9GAMM|nr:protein of unknown function [Methylocaldum szegediense]